MLYFCHRVNRIHVHLTTSERGTGLVDLGLVARAVLDALRIKILLDVFGDSTLHCDRVQPPHIFIYTAQTCLSKVRQKKRESTGRTCSLPTPHPALLRIYDRDGPVEMSRRAGLDTIRRALHLRTNGQVHPPVLRRTVYLHDLLAVRTAVAPEIYGCLYNRAEETGA